jgi:hypothetical protein
MPSRWASAIARSHARRRSIPIVHTFKNELGVDTLLLGFGLDDDNVHAPTKNSTSSAAQRHAHGRGAVREAFERSRLILVVGTPFDDKP